MKWQECLRCYPDNPWCVRVLSVAICITGCIAVANHSRNATLESYDIVTDMIHLESDSPSDMLPVIGHRVRFVTVVGIIAGLAAVIIGALGFVGQMTKSPTRICVYSLGSLILLLVAVWRVVYSFTAMPLLDAAIDQQITEWCLPANRVRYGVLLKCPSRSEQTLPAGETCGPECHSKLELLTKMGGCLFLHRICSDYSFDFVGKGACLAERSDGSLVPAPYRKGNAQTTSMCCRLECNLMNICQGYYFRTETEKLTWHGGQETLGACYVVTPDLDPGPLYPSRETMREHMNETEEEPRRLHAHEKKDAIWQLELEEMYKHCSDEVFEVGSVRSWDPQQPLLLVGSDQRKRTTCWKKGRPKIIQETLDANMYSSIISCVNTVLLLLASTTGLFYQYSLATKRRGRKGLAFLMRQMLCPCVGSNSNRTRKISEDVGSESESSLSRSSSSEVL